MPQIPQATFSHLTPRVLVLVTGALLSPGRRTVTAALSGLGLHEVPSPRSIVRAHLTRARLDPRLSAPPAPRRPGQRGRPRRSRARQSGLLERLRGPDTAQWAVMVIVVSVTSAQNHAVEVAGQFKKQAYAAGFGDFSGLQGSGLDSAAPHDRHCRLCHANFLKHISARIASRSSHSRRDLPSMRCHCRSRLSDDFRPVTLKFSALLKRFIPG